MSDTLATPQQKNFLMPGSRPLLVLIALCGLLLRIGGLNKPVEYDEAYTVVEFSSRSWWAVISDYSLPNNHILHSLLVRASLLSFGQHAWSIRLPALLAGLGMIVAAYFLGKALYSRETGLVAAALVAYFPEMLRFSTTARGYTLVGLFSLLIFWLAQRAVRQPGPRNWILMAVCSSLGLWTIPIMLYPAGGAYLWTALEGPRNRKFFAGWLASGLGTGLLTGLLYSPALVFSGWRRVLANGFVQPVDAKKYFDWLLVSRLRDTWGSWTNHLPWLLTAILVGGFLLSLILHRKIGSSRWSLPLILLAECTLLVLTRRPEVFDRFWFWLLAPLLVWSAGGLVETVRLLPGRRPIGPTVLIWLSVAGLVISTAASLPQLTQNLDKVSNTQASASYIAQQLQPGDVVLVGYPNNAALWYYLMELGVPRTAWQADANAKRFLVLLATNQRDESLESIFKSYKLDPARVDLANSILLAEFGKIQIYSCPPLR